MASVGVAWGFYNQIGRASKAPLIDTAYNFFRTTPFVLVLLAISIDQAIYTFDGILSGGIASAIGYTLWYTALGGLTVMQSAVLQLLVPAIAVIGGVLFVSEALSLQLIISALLILGGILMVVLGKYYFTQVRTQEEPTC